MRRISNRGSRSSHYGVGVAAFALLAALASLLCCPGAAANVYLNELTMRPAGQSETVELYNSGADSVDVGGWMIQGTKGTYTIPGTLFIQPMGRVVVDIGDQQGERGGVTSLIDLVLDGPLVTRALQDEVSYGENGSAPLPPEGASLTRAPDAGAGAPPAPDPLTDGLFWSIALEPTFGGENITHDPAMGSSLVINEFDDSPAGGGDLLELYNPSATAVDLGGWYLINGDAVMFLAGIVPASGYLVIVTDSGFDLDEIGLLYLFSPDNVRVDQIAWHDGPVPEPYECFARCPDGAGPFLGFDWLTSGGGETFMLLPCSLGETNEPCQPSATESTTWGSLKGYFR